MANVKSWWAPVYRGLVCDPKATHYQKMRGALWLYLFLVVHANRQTGHLVRKIRTICNETGLTRRTVLRWLRRLRTEGYITTQNTGRCLEIQVCKWKRLGEVTIPAHQRWQKRHSRGDTSGTTDPGMKSLNTLIQSHKLPPGQKPKRVY